MTERRTGLLAGLVIVLAALAAYHNSLAAPFVFDDTDSIVNNPTIARLWPLGPVLSPPAATGQTVGGRPVLNLTLAADYAIGGLRVESYHVTNLLIHILAGLVLFGLVRRTLARTGYPPGGDGATLLAFAVALLWTVHPLQTESVTYVIQRAESLMGLFYLLTLYGFVRYAEDPEAGRGWAVGSFLACLFGVATKEVMVSAPVMVFLYDRTFVSGGFRQAWRRHGRLLTALAGTWLPLAWLVFSNHQRGGSTGFGSGITWGRYLLTQFPAITRYLWLSVWPHPLIFDYGTRWTAGIGMAILSIAVVAGLAAATVAAVWRRPALGFLGVWFFAILAPTSLVPGNRQTLAEHRMYLALAPVLVALVIVLHWGWSRLAGRPARATLVTCVFLAGAAGALTARRNEDYRTNLSLWGDTVAKLPGNPYAQADLGVALDEAGDDVGALARYTEALRLKPDLRDLHRAHDDMGLALAKLGRLPEAQAQFEEAIRLKPDFPAAHNDLGNALRREGRLGDAEAELQEALRLQPDLVAAWLNLALVFTQAGRWPEAISAYQRAAVLRPDDPETHFQLANVLAQSGQLAAAVPEYQRALRLNPRLAAAHDHLGRALAELGRSEEAAREQAEAARLATGP